jgi:hypothetical protein
MIASRPALLVASGALGAVLSLAGCGQATSGVGASCVGPQLTVTPATAEPGQQVSFSVEWLYSGCRDTNPSTEVVKPLLDVPVEMTQGGRSAVVGTVSGTGEHFTGALRFALPAWLRPGSAEVVLDAPVPQRLPFTVAAGS